MSLSYEMAALTIFTETNIPSISLLLTLEDFISYGG